MKKLYTLLLLLLPAAVFGQAAVSGKVLNQADARLAANYLEKLLAGSDSLANSHSPEKVYLQFDRDYYAAGDTIWFKAYLLNNYLLPSEKSNMLHVDIFNENGRKVKQYKFPVSSGLSWGNISLGDKSGITGGTYTIRAYTNWMRNCGNDCFFYKTIYVADAGESNFLVNSNIHTAAVNGANVLSANLSFYDISKIPFAGAPVHLLVTDGDKHLYKQTQQTGVDGAANLNFNLPQKTGSLAIVAEDEKKDKKAVIPVLLNRAENADVQFMPEGGQLVAGLPVHIGFKAIGEDGKGLDVSGIVMDHNKNQVAQFKSLYRGIGSFDMPVDAGETYTAKVTLPGGMTKEYTLPVVKDAGMILKMKNPPESDSLTVIVAATADIAQSGSSYFLIARARGTVCYAASFSFKGSNAMQTRIAKSLLPTGIAHISLLTSTNQPLNERLVYIDHHDNLGIKLAADKFKYRSRDSVALNIKVTDNDGRPVAGNFSVAVTDDSQAKIDSLSNDNIINRMLLATDLKGYIETPGYYLSTGKPETWQALDNLLLTQGWVGYDWKDVFSPPALTFQPEKDFVVTGHVTNVLNKVVKGTHILLLSQKPQMLIDTITDVNGRFVFDRLPRLDTPLFVLRAVNKRGKSFNVNVNIDEQEPPAFSKPNEPAVMPWYVNTDKVLLNYTKNKQQLKQAQVLAPGGHMLKEVNIKGKKIIKDSQNLNGAGNADFAMDENEIEAADKKTWLQLIEENVKGFNEGSFNLMSPISAPREWAKYSYVTDFHADSLSPWWYFIQRKPVKIIVDGVDVGQLIALTNFRDLKDYLSHETADIKGLEVISTPKYAGLYLTRFDPYDPNTGLDLLTEAFSLNIGADDISFIEITTRGGHGPIINSTPGMYVYRSTPISWPGEFYKPKYKPAAAVNGTDLRSTIDWEPNIFTDANGEAKIWFYTADKPSTYTINVEGADLKGHVGAGKGKIVVESEGKAK